MTKEKQRVDMLAYTDNGTEMINRIKSRVIDHNFKERSKDPTRMIKKEFLPQDTIIMGIYTELFACYYCGLFHAALSVGNELLEYMTKKKYQECLKLKNYPEKNWGLIIKELIKHYKKHENENIVVLLGLIDQIRDKYRNSQNHGNIFQLVDDCEVGDVDLFSGEIIKRKYREDEITSPTGIGTLGKIVMQRHNNAGAEVIAIANIAIVEFFVLS